MAFPSIKLVVASDDPAALRRARRLATQLGLSSWNRGTDDDAYSLRIDRDRVELLAPRSQGFRPFSIDFGPRGAAGRIQRSNRRNEPLIRAVGARQATSYRVVDATPGLGRDAMLLAAYGFRVTLVERSPVVVALLDDALCRAAMAAPQWRMAAQRLTLRSGDSIRWLSALPPAGRPDVVYLDPMFPQRRKSALVRKEMRILQAIVGEDRDSGQLMEVALERARHRVVVKRPKGSNCLGDVRPDHVIDSKSVRYDVYLVSG